MSGGVEPLGQFGRVDFFYVHSKHVGTSFVSSVCILAYTNIDVNREETGSWMGGSVASRRLKPGTDGSL